MLFQFVIGKMTKREKKELNKRTAKLYQCVYDKYSQMAKDQNENVFKIFNDWWNGKSVYNEEYRFNFKKEDIDKAESIILEVVSLGFG